MTFVRRLPRILRFTSLAVLSNPLFAGIISTTPLHEPAETESPTLFSPVPSSVTGIDQLNRYDDPAMWRERFLEFSLGALGTGVAVGDYDQDGLPDIYIASKTGQSRLYRNLGDWKFDDVSEAAGILAPRDAWAQGVAFVDYDNDGHLDLYLCRFDAPNLLYRNHGDGTFSEQAGRAGLDVADASGFASFADYDRDGFLDLYLQTNVLSLRLNPSGQEDYLFRNAGDGTFGDTTREAGISGHGQGHSATWLDYNQDGWPDLYVANDFTPADKLYHNAGNGTFVEALSIVFPHTPNSSMGADISDLNRDGLMDFMVADMATTSHEKDMRGMVDGREEASDPRSNPFAAQQYPRNAVFINSGLGPFFEGAHLMGLAASDWTWSLRFEDLDNDGRDDLHVTTGMIREFHGTDLMNRMRAAKTPQQKTAIVKASPRLEEANLAFRNQGNYHFGEVGQAWGLDEVGISFGAAFGDLDGDGDLDLVYSNYKREPTLMRNDSTTGNRILFELEGVESNRFGIGALVSVETTESTQTKQLSLSRGYLSTSEPILHFGLGAATEAVTVSIAWPSGKTQTLENLAAGFRYRVREPETESRSASAPPKPAIWFEEQSRSLNLLHRTRERILFERKRQPLLPRRHNRLGPALAVGDLTADQRDDIVVGGTPFDPATLFVSEATNAFSPGQAIPPRELPINDGPVLLLDADGDGHDDLLQTGGGAIEDANSPAYQPRLFLNDGRGGFTLANQVTFPEFPVSVGAAAAADFDRDGDLDLFLGGRVIPGDYPSPPESGLFHNVNGSFRKATAEEAPELNRPGMVTAALWSDVDGDGWLDLLIALEWGGVRCFRNLEGSRFEDASEELGFTTGGTGWWNSIAAADFNGDGRVDYAVGNNGLNTQYKASPTRPALLFHGMLPGGDGKSLIEAKRDGDRLVPVRGRAALSRSSSAIKERFTNNNDYAKAELRDIVGEAFLENATAFAATNLASGVFLSEQDGSFAFRELPKLAQFSAIQGMVAADFDGDGRQDLYCVQNSYAPIPSVGRNDGGLSVLMLGDGEGDFQPLLPRDSGILVTGDAKALVVTDFDHDARPDFLVSRNHSSILAYQNRSGIPEDFLRVKLHGTSGNRHGIGARVVLHFQDGESQVAEIYAGSGYLSQSTASLFFGIPKGAALKEIRVRWPDGAESRHDGPFHSRFINLAYPPNENP